MLGIVWGLRQLNKRLSSQGRGDQKSSPVQGEACWEKQWTWGPDSKF